jgi:hypothetical protein
MSATLEAQRRDSLQEANDVRVRRAALKAAIASGRISLAEALIANHDWTRTMRVVILLRVTPGLGQVRINRALIANRISSSLTLEHFSHRRRQELLTWLSANYPSALVSGPKGAGE